MKILFVASEVVPILKVGGIADVVSSLSGEIKKAGHDVRIVIPYYQEIEEKEVEILKEFSETEVKIGKDTQKIKIFETRIREGIPVYLVKNEKYISGGGVYLPAEDFSSITRFLFFSKAVLEVPKVINWTPDIIHSHDWQTGLIALLLKLKISAQAEKIKVLFTIHNLLMQGRWKHEQVLEFLNLKKDAWPTLEEKVVGSYGDDFNVMQQAILNADLITTVSPSYAREIGTKPYFARGLQKEIQARRDGLYGILNGIDTKTYNPLTDPFIKFHYSERTLGKKLLNKIELQKKCHFTLSKNIPLFGLVSRLDVQKGIDLVWQALDEIVAGGAQVVMLGLGQLEYEKLLYRAAKKYPQNIASFIRFDAKLAQEIYAGSDLFLMPSRFEPCGLCQLIAMRYGTIPIVRATGGLKDTVKIVKLRRGFFGQKRIEGTGFVFSGFNINKFKKIIGMALALYRKRGLWKKLQASAISQDFSWTRSAQKYLELYKKLLIT